MCVCECARCGLCVCVQCLWSFDLLNVFVSVVGGILGCVLLGYVVFVCACSVYVYVVCVFVCACVRFFQGEDSTG